MFGRTKAKEPSLRDKACEALARMARNGELSRVELDGLGFSSCEFKRGNHSLHITWWRDNAISRIRFDGKTTPLTEEYAAALTPIVKQRIQDECDKSLAAILEGCPND